MRASFRSWPASGELGILVLEHAPPRERAEIAQRRRPRGGHALARRSSRSGRRERARLPAASLPHGRGAHAHARVAPRSPRAASSPSRSPAPNAEPSRGSDARDRRHRPRRPTRSAGRRTATSSSSFPRRAGIGAHSCRRRILARLSGDRALALEGLPGRSQEPRSKGAPVAVGVATFPHDGADAQALSIKTARARAFDDSRSPVHTLVARRDDAGGSGRRAHRSADAGCGPALSLPARHRGLGALRARRACVPRGAPWRRDDRDDYAAARSRRRGGGATDRQPQGARRPRRAWLHQRRGRRHRGRARRLGLLRPSRSASDSAACTAPTHCSPTS